MTTAMAVQLDGKLVHALAAGWSQFVAAVADGEAGADLSVVGAARLDRPARPWTATAGSI